MSKKKYSNEPDFKTVTLPQNMTISEQFRNYLDKTGRKVSNIITFLSLQNVRLSGIMGNKGMDAIPEYLQEELADFAEEFMETFGDVTYDERMRKWGREPLVLVLGQHFSEVFLYRKQKAELEAVSEDIRREASTLADKIWNIREDRELTFMLNVSPEGLPERLHIEKYEPKEFLDMIYTFVLYDCTVLIMAGGGLVVRVMKKDGVEIFGVRSDMAGSWIPLTADEMLDAHTLCGDGTRLEPEDGVTYTEISKD